MNASESTTMRAMLDTLLVYELKELLEQASQKRSGRKRELIDRLFNYFQHTYSSCLTSTLVEAIKIKVEARVGNCSASRRFRGDHAPPLSSSPTKKAKGSETSYDPIDVRFRSLSFLHQCDVIIHPSLLQGSYLRDGTSRYSMRCEFSLTRNQIEQIVAGKGVDVISGSAVMTYKTKLILRFCLYESSCEQSDRIPRVKSILMNDTELPVPFNLSYKDSSANPYYPFDLTSNCELTEGRKNVLIIYWKNDHEPKQYAFQVSLVKAVAGSDLTTKLRSKVRNSDYTRAMIKDKMKNPLRAKWL
ncbi:E3 SUMO-protein ligase PIAS3-like [Oscarella lobularis]|uniref:E3 SUMO-protein ligase PIAS3-like n=1 Tax=Oscarella lobularis TaxID=121494 RepID=UPI0033131526